MRTLKDDLGPFFRLFRAYWKRMTLAAGLGLITVLASIGLLSLSGWFISAAAFAGLTPASARMFNFFFPSIGVRIFAFLRTGARYADRVVSHDLTFRILEGLRVWFYSRLEPLVPGPLSSRRSGDLLNRIVSDIDALDHLFLRAVSPAAAALIICLVLTGSLWIFNAWMALTAFTALVLAGFVFPALSGLAAVQTGRRIAERTAVLRTRIIDTVQGLPELVMFGAVESQLNAFASDNEALIEDQAEMNRLQGIASAVITLLSGLAMLVILFIGVELVHSERLDGASLALAALAVLAAFEAVMPLPNAFQFFSRTRESGRRLLEISRTKPAVQFPDQSKEKTEQSDIVFENVRFSYEKASPFVLDQFNLHIRQGEKIALMGETGVGKSTLAHLLVRFREPAEGRILIGGQDIRDISETDLRQMITMISQDAHMFNASLRDNLLIACPEADDAALMNALKTVKLDAFAESLPDGLDTWIGEAGKQISGGQARRLAAARAVLTDATIWILDEPTEGLDTVTEQKMMEALFAAAAEKTIILITHRQVCLERMDRVMVLEKGRVRLLFEKGMASHRQR